METIIICMRELRGRFMARYFELRASGYRVLWTGEGKICFGKPLDAER